ncbi:MAG: F0F1 ATP synthase subunit A [Tissierellia bacterium]|nr:F0F1 ATP synthase subunit A [Tissierellia bacterium]
MNIRLSFSFNDVKIDIHPTVVNSIVILVVLTLLAIWIGNKAKKADFREKPKGILFFAEIFVETIRNLTTTTMGQANINFSPYIGTLAIYLVFANLMGLIGFQPPTSDYNVTLGLALITFVLIHFNNIRFNGIKNYVKGFFEPMAFLFPINLLGEIATPISLSFRLFGNILSGVIIMSLLYQALSSVSIFLVPFVAPVFHAYFDIFSGLIQTFIFVMLTMVFVSNGIGERK